MKARKCEFCSKPLVPHLDEFPSRFRIRRFCGKSCAVKKHHADKATNFSDSFWNRTKRTKSGCILWTGYTNPWGYGRVRFHGRMLRTHQVAWELTKDPIPFDLCVLHKCDNPPCVNPDHLFLGTQADNVADRERKGRTACGERMPNAKLSSDAVREIHSASKKGSSRVSLARRFGVSPQRISEVALGKAWRHV